MKFRARPNIFNEAAEWVFDQYQERERSKTAIYVSPLESEIVPTLTNIPRSLVSLKMGHAVFAEARASHKSLSLWAVDFLDGKGARVQIGPLVAEPTRELPPWEIELN